MTKAEVCLWKYVLKGKKTGQVFRRQRPIDVYIVDFVCLTLKLIIEVDGESHNHQKIAENDMQRQRKLESLGFVFLRFQDEEVLKEIDGVALAIESKIAELSG